MWTLKVCVGLFLGLCGQYFEVDYESEAACMKGREQIVKQVGDGYAICAPRKERSK